MTEHPRRRPSRAAGATLAALDVGFKGLWLSAAALVASAGGMVASDVVLVPALLVWLFGVGRDAGQRA
jgi:hypothetical protein